MRSAGLLAALAAGIGLYEGIFKFPAAVRTVKSLRRKYSTRKGFQADITETTQIQLEEIFLKKKNVI